MHPYVRKLQRSDEYYFKEGCYIIEVSNTDQDSAVSIAHVRVLPGQQTAWHWLTETYERYVILRDERFFRFIEITRIHVRHCGF